MALLSDDTHSVLEQQRGLGRIPVFNPKDQQHKMSAVAPIEVTVERRIWDIDSSICPLDQGQTSQCTAYGTEHFLLAGPMQQTMYLTPARLYALNQKFDEWEGSETVEPRYEGSSVHAAMKVLKAAGLISQYVWAFEADSVRRWTMMRSPVVIGVDWYEGMNRTTTAGFARVRGKVLGGHCLLIIGGDERVRCPDGTKGAAILLNSWGRNWGYKNSGYAFISWRDLDKLIKHGGEAATATEFLNTSPINLEGLDQLPE